MVGDKILFHLINLMAWYWDCGNQKCTTLLFSFSQNTNIIKIQNGNLLYSITRNVRTKFKKLNLEPDKNNDENEEVAQLLYHHADQFQKSWGASLNKIIKNLVFIFFSDKINLDRRGHQLSYSKKNLIEVSVIKIYHSVTTNTLRFCKAYQIVRNLLR